MKAATRYVFCRTVKFFDVHQMQYLTSSDGESNPVRYVLSAMLWIGQMVDTPVCVVFWRSLDSPHFRPSHSLNFTIN